MPIVTRAMYGQGPIGAGAVTPITRVYGELLAGVIDGVNDTFTAAVIFTQEAVYYNGLRQRPGAVCDYTLAESGGVGTGFDTVIFAVPPRTGDNVIIDYNPVP